MLWLALLLTQNDPESQRLFESFRERVEKARTIRVEFQFSLMGTVDVRGVLKSKEGNRWFLSLESSVPLFEKKERSVSVLCDGRKMIGKGVSPLSPMEGLAQELRTWLTTGSLVILLNLLAPDLQAQKTPSVIPSQFRDGGKERIGEREARVLEYRLDIQEKTSSKTETQVKLYLDSATGLPLQRTLGVVGAQLIETFLTFTLDEDLPDTDFSFQSLRGLAQARTRQLARSVELFGIFTGRHPDSLEDLLQRSKTLDPDIFWPEGGFVLGGEIRKDPWDRPFELRRGRVVSVGSGEEIACDVPPVTRRAIGAPSEELRNYYTARVRMHLLDAAIRAFRDTYRELPGRKTILWQKPDWAEVWPEGGWAPGGIPRDPWGDPYRVISDLEWVRIQVKDPRSRTLVLAPEIRKEMDFITRVRLTIEESDAIQALVEQLRNDDLDLRERAEEELTAWGPAIASVLQDRLKEERDEEVKARLHRILSRIPPAPRAWLRELAPLVKKVGEEDAADFSENEENAIRSLKALATAEAEFRSNDRDLNNIRDFWTGDVAGLMLVDGSLASADLRPIRGRSTSAPKHGYWFLALKEDKQVTANGGSGIYGQDTDESGRGVHNTSRFGFAALPETYGVSGTKVFILNENNTVFWRDFGKDVLTEEALPNLADVFDGNWPTDAEIARSWEKLE